MPIVSSFRLMQPRLQVPSQFNYSAVPLAPGARPLRLQFSYFDPEVGEYRTVESEPRSIVIEGEAIMSSGPVRESPPVMPDVPDSDLAPLASEAGGIGNLTPYFERSWFYPSVSGLFLLGLSLLIVGHRRNSLPDQAKLERERMEESLSQAVASARSAAEKSTAGKKRDQQPCTRQSLAFLWFIYWACCNGRLAIQPAKTQRRACRNKE